MVIRQYSLLLFVLSAFSVRFSFFFSFSYSFFFFSCFVFVDICFFTLCFLLSFLVLVFLNLFYLLFLSQLSFLLHSLSFLSHHLSLNISTAKRFLTLQTPNSPSLKHSPYTAVFSFLVQPIAIPYIAIRSGWTGLGAVYVENQSLGENYSHRDSITSGQV